jgi:hypothetical protein
VDQLLASLGSQHSFLCLETVEYNYQNIFILFNRYNTIQYNTIQYNTIQYNTIQYNTIQYNTIQYNTTQHNTTQHNTRQHNTIQYNTIQYKELSRIICLKNHFAILGASYINVRKYMHLFFINIFCLFLSYTHITSFR